MTAQPLPDTGPAIEVLARPRLELTAKRDELTAAIEQVDQHLLALLEPGQTVEVDGQPVLAAVHDIPHRCTYTALAGDGAFLDGAALTRRTTAARLAVLSSGLLADLASCDPATLGAVLRRFKLRNFGSQALHLCHAAAGHVAMVASREARGWDDLAGALIAREAGLIYGSYLPDPTRRPGDEQYSLCAPADLFDHYALTLAASGRTNTNGA